MFLCNTKGITIIKLVTTFYRLNMHTDMFSTSRPYLTLRFVIFFSSFHSHSIHSEKFPNWWLILLHHMTPTRPEGSRLPCVSFELCQVNHLMFVVVVVVVVAFLQPFRKQKNTSSPQNSSEQSPQPKRHEIKMAAQSTNCKQISVSKQNSDDLQLNTEWGSNSTSLKTVSLQICC